MRALLAICLLLSTCAPVPAFADALDGGELAVYRTDAGSLVEALPDGGALDVPPAVPIDAGDPSPYTGDVLPTARARWIAGRVAACDDSTPAYAKAIDEKVPPLFSTPALVVGLIGLGVGLVGGVYLGIRLAK